MRFVLPLALILVACGLSKAEIAARNCDRALSVSDYDAATAYCKEAMVLNRADKSLTEKWVRASSLRDARDFRLSEEARRRQDLTERQVDAAERAAAAAEQQANTLARAEARQH